MHQGTAINKNFTAEAIDVIQAYSGTQTSDWTSPPLISVPGRNLKFLTCWKLKQRTLCDAATLPLPLYLFNHIKTFTSHYNIYTEMDRGLNPGLKVYVLTLYLLHHISKKSDPHQNFYSLLNYELCYFSQAGELQVISYPLVT